MVAFCREGEYSFPALTLILSSTHSESESVSCSVESDSLDPIDSSLPGSSVLGILQVRILEWVAMPSSRGSSWPRDQTWVSYIAGKFFSVVRAPNSSCTSHPLYHFPGLDNKAHI